MTYPVDMEMMASLFGPDLLIVILILGIPVAVVWLIIVLARRHR